MMSEHRHFPPGIPEHDYEPELGLPESLPEQEKILWQGSPDWKLVALRIIRLRAIVIYFVLLLAVQAFGVWSETASLNNVAFALLKTTPFVLFAVACFAYLAWAMANNAVYTITSKRVVLRIGIALTLTYNLPFSRIAAANVLKRPDGSGDIALELQSADKIAWINLWPHVRAWKLAHPQPLLRCLPKIDPVAEILSKAWQESRGDTPISITPARVTAPSSDNGLQSPATVSAHPSYMFSNVTNGKSI
jgi:Bacterial PH domain